MKNLKLLKVITFIFFFLVACNSLIAYDYITDHELQYIDTLLKSSNYTAILNLLKNNKTNPKKLREAYAYIIKNLHSNNNLKNEKIVKFIPVLIKIASEKFSHINKNKKFHIDYQNNKFKIKLSGNFLKISGKTIEDLNINFNQVPMFLKHGLTMLSECFFKEYQRARFAGMLLFNKQLPVKDIINFQNSKNRSQLYKYYTAAAITEYLVSRNPEKFIKFLTNKNTQFTEKDNKNFQKYLEENFMPYFHNNFILVATESFFFHFDKNSYNQLKSQNKLLNFISFLHHADNYYPRRYHYKLDTVFIEKASKTEIIHTDNKLKILIGNTINLNAKFLKSFIKCLIEIKNLK